MESGSDMILTDQMLERLSGVLSIHVSLSPLRHKRQSQISLVEALRAGHAECQILCEGVARSLSVLRICSYVKEISPRGACEPIPRGLLFRHESSI